MNKEEIDKKAQEFFDDLDVDEKEMVYARNLIRAWKLGYNEAEKDGIERDILGYKAKLQEVNEIIESFDDE